MNPHRRRRPAGGAISQISAAPMRLGTWRMPEQVSSGDVLRSGVRRQLRVILSWDFRRLSRCAAPHRVRWPCGGAGAAAGKDVQADVAAHLGPFVVLLGQHGADQADEGFTAGEDPDDVGAAADLSVEPLLRVVAPDLPGTQSGWRPGSTS